MGDEAKRRVRLYLITVVSLLLNSWSLGRCCDGWFALSRLSLRRKCGT